MRFAALLLLALLTMPLAAAQGEERIDVRVVIAGEGTPAVGGEGARLLNATPGQSARLALNLTKNYTTFEVRVSGWDVQRARQVVPLLFLDPHEPTCVAKPGSCDYTLFEQFPNERIWDVDGPARVFFTNGTAGEVVLRLGIPGPVNATLVVERDVTPPTFVVRPPQNLTHIGFYQETTTNELALADLQVRPASGGGEWVRNPTPVYHFLQRFPVQGLHADSEYEARVVFTDWAENEATSAPYRVRTLPEPVRPIPVVTPLSPEPNATVARDGVVVRASYQSPESPVLREGVRLFFDKQEVSEKAGHTEGEVAYTVPTPLAPGLHSVSVEVTNEAGGRGVARWTFQVEGREAGAAPWAALAGLAIAAIVATRRR